MSSLPAAQLRTTEAAPLDLDAAAAGEWLIQCHRSPEGIAPEHWNALLAASPAPTPFMRHEWLAALHDTECASPDTGWTPMFLSAHRAAAALGTAPEAVCAVYAKTHSYGEYVFDWAWANAYQQHGLRYYPKLLCASPFSPVPGSRLLARSPQGRLALLAGLRQQAQTRGMSSAHLLFPDALDREAAQTSGWMLRQGVQFHWHNRHAHSANATTTATATEQAPPYVDFADFLSHLHRDKRKKIQQERRRVAEAGVIVQVRQGSQITPADWDFFYSCYRQTYLEHGGPPYLSRAFFEQVARTLTEHWLMFTAVVAGEPVAASLVGIDTCTGVAWGRYWGSVRHIPCLHFELCYYAPLAWCIEQRFARFEGGAQGEHKLARGLLPVPTWSAHWLADARFADAVNQFLARECAGIDAYVDELRDRLPFKAAALPPACEPGGAA